MANDERPAGADDDRSIAGFVSEHLLVVSAGLVLAGVVVIAVSFRVSPSLASALGAQAGSALLSTGGLALLWQLLAERWARVEREGHQRRLFAELSDDLLRAQTAQIGADLALRDSATVFGLREIAVHRLPSEVVRSALATAERVRILMMVDAEWRDRHFTDLESALQRGCSVDVALPDPENAELMRMLGARFGRDVTAEVKTNVAFFSAFAERGLRCEISLTETPPTYSAYMFEDRDPAQSVAAMRLLGNSVARGSYLPTLVCGPGGRLWQFLAQDIDRLGGTA